MALDGNLNKLQENILKCLPMLNSSRLNSNAAMIEAIMTFNDDEDESIEYQIVVKVKQKSADE